MINLNPLKDRPLAFSWLILFSLLHLGIVLANHYYYRTFAYYYGVYNFAFFDYAHLRGSPVPVLFDGTNSTFIQDHFSLLLQVLSPLYWLLKDLTGSYTLLILQWIAIVFGGLSTYRLVSFRSENGFLATCAMICYFMLYSRFASYIADCNLAIIGSALVPGFLYYFWKKKTLPVLILYFIMVITREDFPLWLVFICLFLVIAHWRDKENRNFAAVLMLVSALIFVLIMGWIIPALESETKQFALFNYAAIGSNAKESLLFILSHPVESFKLLFVNHLGDPAHDGVKAGYYLVFGISGGILLLTRPEYLLCLVPVIAKKMYNDDPLRWGYESYYGIETASILPALVFLVISGYRLPKLRTVGAVSVCVLTLTVTVYCFKTINYPFIFTKTEFYKAWFYRRDYNFKELNRELSRIPDGAAVSASARILPHIAMREKIYYFPVMNDAEYLCLSIYGDTWPISMEEYDGLVKKLRESGDWETLYYNDNAMILKKTK